MKGLDRSIPPGLRREIRAAKQNHNVPRLRERIAATRRAVMAVANNIWFVTLVGGVIAGIAATALYLRYFP